MTTQKPVTEQDAVQVHDTALDAPSVLAASLKRETAREDTDLELLGLLESTILRVDASDGSWEQAAAAIKKLVLSRTESRMKLQ